MEAGLPDSEEESSGRGHVIWFSFLAASVVVLLILTRISIAMSFHSTVTECPPSPAGEEYMKKTGNTIDVVLDNDSNIVAIFPDNSAIETNRIDTS